MRAPIAVVYLSGFLVGVALITFPAAGPFLTSPSGFALSSSQYGLLFVPQIVAAIGAALLVWRWGARLGTKKVVLAGTASSLLSMLILVAAGQLLPNRTAAYGLLLVGTFAAGTGFSAGYTALNVYAVHLFEGRSSAGVTGLHMLGTVGSLCAPLLFSVFSGSLEWWGAPLLIAALLCLLLALQVRVIPSLRERDAGEAEAAGLFTGHRRILIWAGLVLLYGCCEATFSNWGAVYARQDQGLSAGNAAVSLSVFWAAVTVGRFAFTTAKPLRTRAAFIASPFAVALSLEVLPSLHGWPTLLGGYVLAGLACSYCLPNAIGLASDEYVGLSSAVSATMMTSLFLGQGIGSFVPGLLRGGLGLPLIFRLTAVYALGCSALAIWLMRDRLRRSSVSRIRGAGPDPLRRE